MYDLIYTGNYNDYQEISKIIKEEYEQAKIEDGSDQIHEHRFSVEFELEEEEWFTFVITKGFALCSLNFQLVLQGEPDRLKKLIDKLNLGEPNVNHAKDSV